MRTVWVKRFERVWFRLAVPATPQPHEEKSRLVGILATRGSHAMNHDLEISFGLWWFEFSALILNN